MSKIAKIPVTMKDVNQVSLEKDEIKVIGPKGNLSFRIPPEVKVDIAEKDIKVSVKKDTDRARAMSGLTRAYIANMIVGTTDGFTKKLELTGVGYRAQASGNKLTLNVGFAHPVIIEADQTISFAVEENVITVAGVDKVMVGDVAAKVRAVRPPEPYKGKGIKYQGEYIRRKVGKAAAGSGE